jgi:hypothetical protein
MQLNELFSQNDTKEIPAQETRKYGLDDVLAAYQLDVGKEKYIFYFDACGGKPLEPNFGFGKVITEYGRLKLSHSITNDNIPFKILAAAIHCIAEYLEKHNPISITFKGAYSRQQEFYHILVKRFAGKLPPSYKMVLRDHSQRFYITRNEDILAMPTTKVIEARIDELFDAPVAEYELEPISIPEAIKRFHVDGFSKGYVFNVHGIEYIVYFTQDGRGKYHCSFGRGKEEGGIAFHLTGTRDQFRVFRLVFAGIKRFISESRPITISASGYLKKQSAFYGKIMKAYAHLLPKPYYVTNDDLDNVLITRKKEKAVTEDAAADVSRVRVAERIVNKYIHWLANANEEAPLEDIMQRTYRPNKNEHILFADGETIGLPKGYHDLNIGFAWGDGPPNVRGWLNTLVHPMGGPPKYIICLVRQTDPSKDTDLAYEMGYEQKEYLVHEVTHYLDYKRAKDLKPGSTQKLVKKRGTTDGYYNSPLEFNAFFQQGLHAILKDLRERPAGSRFRKEDAFDSFANFLKDHLFLFDRGFRDHLDATYQKKFKRRLYKLYTLIKANPNDPDKVAREAQGFTD